MYVTNLSLFYQQLSCRICYQIFVVFPKLINQIPTGIMKIDSVRQSAYLTYINNELRTSYLNWYILKGHQSQYSLVLIKTKKNC